MSANYYLELPEINDALIQDLAEITVDVVKGGASVGFMDPFELDEAIEFWKKVMVRVQNNEIILVVAKDTESHKAVGTAQLVISMPTNQTHRADVAKMQVHSSRRKEGIGGALLKHLEKVALEHGRYVLVLDTVPSLHQTWLANCRRNS
jgi:GNAT superfamily N-acetyltransferase